MNDIHKQRIDRIVNHPETEDDHAARNEILALRAKIAELQKPVRAGAVTIKPKRFVAEEDDAAEEE